MSAADALRLTFDTPAVAGLPKARNTYEAGQYVRRTYGWHAPSTFPNDILFQLTALRDRSRAALRNDGYAKGIVDKLVANVVGTGIKPLSKALDPALRAQIQALFLRWTDESDADGLFDFYGQQTLAVRTWFSAGESFTRMRLRLLSDGLSVPLQLQILEPEFCPHTYSTTLPSGNKVRAGIEFNGIGQRVAYHFYQSRPGDLQDMDVSQLRRVPAESVIHLYDPLRPGQLRGVVHLAQTLVRLHELKKMDDAVLLKQQIGNMFVGFLKRGPGNQDAGIHPLTGLPPDTTFGQKPMVALEPATFQELDHDEEVTFSEPPAVAAGYKDFMRQQLMAAAASTGVPYELITGDMSGLNDRVVRVLLNEFAGRIEAWQHQVVAFQWCRRIYRAFLDRAFLAAALPLPLDYVTDPHPYVAVKFTPPRRRYLHPVQDVDAQVGAMRAGLISRTAVVSEWGEDAETVDQEQADDNARADALQLKYDSDGRQAKNSATPPPDADDPPAQPVQTEGAAA